MSFIFLGIYNHLIARHLATIARYVSRLAWSSEHSPLILNRKAPNNQDDLDNIVNAIEESRQRHVASRQEMLMEIEQRKAVEMRLEEKAQSLEKTNKLLGETNREQIEFAYSVSHDLKSPTNTIAMIFNELAEIKSELKETSETSELSSFIQMGIDTSERMKILIESVLSYSQLIEGSFEFNDVPLARIVDHVKQDLRADTIESKAEIFVDDLPSIRGDETQLRMLFQNLINNGLKFRSRDRQPIIRIVCEPKSDDNSIVISIEDNGIGFEQKHSEIIFGLFKRLHRFEEYKGTGVGLTICKRIMMNHSGDITVVSEPGKGAKFFLQFNKRL